MKLVFNIEKKILYIFAILFVAFTAVIFVLAYGTNNPANFGHTYQEIEGMPNPNTLYASNNDGSGSGLDADKLDGKHDGQVNADKIDGQDVLFQGLGTQNPKICIQNGACSTQSLICSSTGSLTKFLGSGCASQCSGYCNTNCRDIREVRCQYNCDGNTLQECSGGTSVSGSQACTGGTGSCDSSSICECDCTGEGVEYISETVSPVLYCTNLIRQ